MWPRGKASSDPVFGGYFSQNGNGDMTGTHWLEESGFLDGPVLITNTHSVGVVRDAYLAWLVKNKRKPGTNVFAGGFYTYPVVAETYDGYLNDINGFHVKPEDVAAALESAASGRVPEGNVGGGTGMVCYGFKGGIGTSSRKLTAAQGGYTVGALVQCNCGSRGQLRIGGLPVGQELPPTRPSPAWAILIGRTRAPSSSWWRRMRRCCRTRPSGWPAAPQWGWRVPAPHPATDREISLSLSPRVTRAPPRQLRRLTSPCCPTTGSTLCSKPRFKPRRKRSSTP